MRGGLVFTHYQQFKILLIALAYLLLVKWKTKAKLKA